MTSDAPISLALEATLRRLANMIRAVGARHGLDDADLDLLMQDVRIRLWQAHPDSEEIGRLPTSYVYRTARTAAADLIRTRRRHQEREPALDVAPTSALAAPQTSDATALVADLGAAIGVALGKMVQARRVVVQFHLQGYDRDEMRALLGWSDDKLRNLLYRGLQDLRTHLTAMGFRWPEEG